MLKVQIVVPNIAQLERFTMCYNIEFFGQQILMIKSSPYPPPDLNHEWKLKRKNWSHFAERAVLRC
jgi:hypothetical protein